MNVQECKFCQKVKPVSEFTMRKRPPIVPYQNCKTCEPVAYGIRHKGDYRSEMREMREKTKRLRKFTPAQDVEIYRRVMSGAATRKFIAAEHGVSATAVANAFKRGRAMA